MLEQEILYQELTNQCHLQICCLHQYFFTYMTNLAETYSCFNRKKSRGILSTDAWTSPPKPSKRQLHNNSYIFLGFLCVYVPLPPLRGQHTVRCHPRWLPTSGLTEFAVCWGGAGFEPRTTDLQLGALPLSHLSSIIISSTSWRLCS